MPMKNRFWKNQKQQQSDIYFFVDGFMFYIIFVLVVAWEKMMESDKVYLWLFWMLDKHFFF